MNRGSVKSVTYILALGLKRDGLRSVLSSVWTVFPEFLEKDNKFFGAKAKTDSFITSLNRLQGLYMHMQALITIIS